MVFLDAAAAEALHWSGGPVMLFLNGALNVKQFSSFEVNTYMYLENSDNSGNLLTCLWALSLRVLN